MFTARQDPNQNPSRFPKSIMHAAPGDSGHAVANGTVSPSRSSEQRTDGVSASMRHHRQCTHAPIVEDGWRVRDSEQLVLRVFET
jgi:hypothetical protein